LVNAYRRDGPIALASGKRCYMPVKSPHGATVRKI